MTLVHALVILKINYCNAVYMGLPLKAVWKLKKVQITVARLVSGPSEQQSYYTNPDTFALIDCVLQGKVQGAMFYIQSLTWFGPWTLQSVFPSDWPPTCTSQAIMLQVATQNVA